MAKAKQPEWKKKLRKLLEGEDGMTQVELSIELGCSTSTIWRMLNVDDYEPLSGLVIRIEEVYDEARS